VPVVGPVVLLIVPLPDPLFAVEPPAPALVVWAEVALDAPPEGALPSPVEASSSTSTTHPERPPTNDTTSRPTARHNANMAPA
jgi:hypothetical protein